MSGSAPERQGIADLVMQPHHTALVVEDFETARAFFTDVIGMTLEGEMDERGEENLGRVVGLPGACVRWALLRLGGYRLELFKYLRPQGERVAIRQCDTGFTHIAFQVSDAEAAVARLRALGWQTVSDPLPLRNGAAVAVYVAGPEGAIVELLELRP